MIFEFPLADKEQIEALKKIAINVFKGEDDDMDS